MLEGQETVFHRRTLKTYRLTCAGEKIAASMQDVQQIVEDAWKSAEIVCKIPA